MGALGALLGRFEVGFGRVWDGSGEGLGWVFAAGQLEIKFESSSIHQFYRANVRGLARVPVQNQCTDFELERKRARLV